MKYINYICVGVLFLMIGMAVMRGTGVNTAISPENDPEVIRVVKMIDTLQPNVPSMIKIPIAIAIVSNGSYFNIPYHQLVAVAYKESRFNPLAKNKTGDRGVMQVNLHWGRDFYEKESDLFIPYKCVESACRMIKNNESMGKGLEYYHSWTASERNEYKTDLNRIIRRIKDV